MSTHAVALEGITKRYGSVVAVDVLDRLAVEQDPPLSLIHI